MPFCVSSEWRGLIQDESEGFARAPDARADQRLRRLRPDLSARSRWATCCRLFDAHRTCSGTGAGSPVAVVGGGTGMIGDPSGKIAERNLLDDEHDRRQLGGHPGAARALRGLLAGPTRRRCSTTASGSPKYGLIEFLRDIGKHFSVPYMLAKDSVADAPGRGHVVHRVLVHDPPGDRLPAPLPRARRRDADGRRRPVGQHHRRASS